MTDHGHDLTFGAFLSPVASPPQRPAELAVVAEQAGLDLVGFQDHPYQPKLQDTWTLMSYVAARTQCPRVVGDVLRPPATLARAAASLDRLSGRTRRDRSRCRCVPGRRRGDGRPPRGGFTFDGTFSRVAGAHRGPAPTRQVPIHVGAYGPRMLRLTGRVADGWLPSLNYPPDGPGSLTGMSAQVDGGADEAGRDPCGDHPTAQHRRALRTERRRDLLRSARELVRAARAR